MMIYIIIKFNHWFNIFKTHNFYATSTSLKFAEWINGCMYQMQPCLNAEGTLYPSQQVDYNFANRTENLGKNVFFQFYIIGDIR